MSTIKDEEALYQKLKNFSITGLTTDTHLRTVAVELQADVSHPPRPLAVYIFSPKVDPN